MQFSPSRIRESLVLSVLLAGMVTTSWYFVHSMRQAQVLSHELAAMKHASHGLLNAHAWARQIAPIIEERVRTFELRESDRETLKGVLEVMVDTLIVGIDRHLRETSRENIVHQITDTIRRSMVDLERVRSGVPKYAGQILQELERGGNRQEIERLLTNLFEHFTRGQQGDTPAPDFRGVERAYACTGVDACTATLQQRLDGERRTAFLAALSCLLLMASILLFHHASAPPAPAARHAALAAGCFILLLGGVLTPMIEVDARIEQISFPVLGGEIRFSDQVLYFQSKSVLDVTWLLLETGEPDMLLVGILVMTFAVLFPVAKLASTIVYTSGRPSLRQSPLVRFFALESGKWSMADVFVVAIFMAFIGFDGIIEQQMRQLSDTSQAQGTLVTTNGTQLMGGFYMFLGFCLASLWVSREISQAAAKTDV